MPTRALRGLRICAARSRSPAPKGRERSRTFAPTWTAPLRREWPRRSCVAAWTSSPSSGSLSSFGRTRRSSEIRVGSRRAGARRRRATCAPHPATLVAPSTPPTVCAAPAPLPSPWGRARGTTSRRALRVRHCRSASEKTSANGHFLDLDSSDLFPRSFAQSAVPRAFPDTKSASCDAGCCRFPRFATSKRRIRVSPACAPPRPRPTTDHGHDRRGGSVPRHLSGGVRAGAEEVPGEERARRPLVRAIF
jgi:hypothetical protein